MDNSISKWTLLEAKLYCKNRGHKSECCEGCRIADDNGYCAIQNAPEKWDIAEETDATDATDTNVGHKPEKPRLAEVLGVEVGERFGIKDFYDSEIAFYLDEDGVMRWIIDKETSDAAIYIAINHPESIIRATRLTEAELAICKDVGAKYIARDKDSPWVTLHLEKPEPLSTGCYSFKGYIGTLDENLFPSVALGDCICVEEAGRDA